MASPFNQLRERLLRAGVAPRHVRRYFNELADHFNDLRAEEERAGRSPAEAESAAFVRLGGMDDLANAMIAQRQFQSPFRFFCVLAPWAAFGLAPVLLLALGYLVACSILASGWTIFLNGSPTPFVKVSGAAEVYFGIGRSLYFASPVLIGWAIALTAARHRLKALWPTVGLVVIACIGAAAQVHATRTAAVSSGIPLGPTHVTLALNAGNVTKFIAISPYHAAAILALTLLPWLVWKLRSG
ncbi:MAG: hypothetical protein ABSG51_08220 [Terracidiphilus sp.]|jgi:hypothetical protein